MYLGVLTSVRTDDRFDVGLGCGGCGYDEDPEYIREAARRGIFAYITHDNPDELRSAIDITLQRFAEYHELQGAFGRRAVIEQAKGILMARNRSDADSAFNVLRDHSQRTGRKISDLADAIVQSHLLLLPADEAASLDSGATH